MPGLEDRVPTRAEVQAHIDAGTLADFIQQLPVEVRELILSDLNSYKNVDVDIEVSLPREV